MESSLHQQLKAHYAGPDCRCESRVGRFRIDVESPSELIEIQQAGLGAIRAKIGELLERHRVRVVWPLVQRKWIVKVDRRGNPTGKRRLSPRRGTIFDLFEDWIHFASVFPHERLVVEIARIDIEEWRRPERRRGWRRKDYRVVDRKLVAHHGAHELHSPNDLLDLLPDCDALPHPFGTRELAQRLGVARWQAQQIAYCLRHCHALQVVGKQGNALQYVVAREAA